MGRDVRPAARRLSRLVAAILAVGAFGGLGAPPAASAGTVSDIATLSVSGAPGQALDALAVSSGTLVAQGVGIAYVFTRPASGWHDETQAATLIDPEGIDVQPTVAASGQVAAVAEQDVSLRGPSFVDVFVEPRGGWSGVVHQAARLLASDGAGLRAPSISGETIVASGTDRNTGQTMTYVFTEPARGWSGTVHEVAKLSGGPAVVSGAMIFAEGAHNRAVRAYAEPAGGWTNNVGLAATLVSPRGLALTPLAASAGAVLAGDSVFTKPNRGWSGAVKPSARLLSAGGSGYSGGCCQSSSGVVATISASKPGAHHECPCYSLQWMFTQPSGGWSGEIMVAPAIRSGTEIGPVRTALDGYTLFSTFGGKTVKVQRVTGPFGRPLPRHRHGHGQR